MFASCHMDTHPGECHIRVGVDSVDSENISTRSHPLMLDYYKLFYKQFLRESLKKPSEIMSDPALTWRLE